MQSTLFHLCIVSQCGLQSTINFHAVIYMVPPKLPWQYNDFGPPDLVFGLPLKCQPARGILSLSCHSHIPSLFPMCFQAWFYLQNYRRCLASLEQVYEQAPVIDYTHLVCSEAPPPGSYPPSLPTVQ